MGAVLAQGPSGSDLIFAYEFRSVAMSESPLARQDWIFAVFCAVILLLHLASWSGYPPDVDPINFMVALGGYDVTIDAPHAPGYPLYVLLGKAASVLVGPASAYQAVNLAALMLTGLLLYLVGRRHRMPWVGAVAAALWMTHPLVWAATTVQESYVSDALFGTTLVWACLSPHSRWQRSGLIVAIFIGFGLVRPVSCAMLFPLAVVASVLAEHRGRPPLHLRSLLPSVLAPAAAAIVGVLFAYGATVVLAGGFETYREATTRVMGQAFSSMSVLGGAPASAHANMLARLGSWMLMCTAPLAVATAWVLWQRRQAVDADHTLGTANADRLNPGQQAGTDPHDQAWPTAAYLILLAAWAGPAIGFYALIYFLKPTYLLITLPAIEIGCALMIMKLRLRHHAVMLAAGIVAAQLLFYHGGLIQRPDPLFRITRQAHERTDMAWMSLQRDLQQRCDARDPLLWISHERLPLYVLRLIPREADVAVMPPGDIQARLLDPSAMRWSEQTWTQWPAHATHLCIVSPDGVRRLDAESDKRWSTMAQRLRELAAR